MTWWWVQARKWMETFQIRKKLSSIDFSLTGGLRRWSQRSESEGVVLRWRHVQALALSISNSSLWRGALRWRCSHRKLLTTRSAVCRSRGRLISRRPVRRCSLRDISYSCRASWSSSWNLWTKSGQSTVSASGETPRGISTYNSTEELWSTAVQLSSHSTWVLLLGVNHSDSKQINWKMYPK